MMNIPRVLGLIPVPNDGTSYYRAVVPFNALHLEGKINFDFTLAEQVIDWDNLSRYDTIFFQRPYSMQHVQNCINAKLMNKKVVIDYDDYLFGLQKDNSLYKVYSTEQAAKNMTYMLNNADVIMCSTQYLAELLMQKTDRHQRFKVVENALDDSFLKIGSFATGDGIMYRGAQSHRNDLKSVAPQMINVGKHHPISFFGFEPKFITSKIDYFHYPFTGILRFYDNIRNGLWQVMVVPLCDNDFNRAKSNIAWIEGTFAGAAILAPWTQEWDIPGITNYKDAEHFEALLRMMINDKGYCEEKWVQSKDYINENLLLSWVNKKRLETLLWSN